MDPITDVDQKLLNDIKEYGWHVVKVMRDENDPGFGYSVGLYKSYGHPEIIIIGLKLDLIHSIINRIGEEIKGGKVFAHGQYYADLIQGFDCYFISVEMKYYDNYVGYAKWYYKGTDFPLMQCIYPTIHGVYPWQKEWPETLSALQPILGLVDV